MAIKVGKYIISNDNIKSRFIPVLGDYLKIGTDFYKWLGYASKGSAKLESEWNDKLFMWSMVQKINIDNISQLGTIRTIIDKLDTESEGDLCMLYPTQFNDIYYMEI